MRTRKDKIEFLRGIITGARTVNELLPVKNYSFIQDDKNPDLFKEVNGDRILTDEQLDEFQKKNPNSHFFIVISAQRRSRPGATQLDFNLAS